MFEEYDERYYRTGNYGDYLQRGERYFKLTEETVDILKKLGLIKEPFLDFGCSVGFVVESLEKLGYTAHGVDVSRWAIEQCLNKNLNCSYEINKDVKYGVTFALDVLEHLEENELTDFLKTINTDLIVFRMPICLEGEDDYFLKGARSDKTHKIKWTKSQWQKKFRETGYFPIDLNLSTIYCAEGGYSGIAIRT